jgi:hypothetical protein
VNLRKILTYALVAFVIWWVVQQPASAAHLVHDFAGLLTKLAKDFSSFVASI